MSFGGFLIMMLLIFLAAGLIGAAAQSSKLEKMTPSQRRSFHLTMAHGVLRPQMICPHCQQSGKVHCKPVTNKKGISGGKATGAILTGGVSLLATGLSRKETATQAFCENCSSSWQF